LGLCERIEKNVTPDSARVYGIFLKLLISVKH